MDLRVEFYPLNLSESEKKNTHTWGVANVIVNGVSIRNIRAMNKKTESGEWQHFFAYPRLKIGDNYQDVVALSKDQKNEIEAAIQNEAKESLLKKSMEVIVEKISIVVGKVPLLAIANVKANGIGINSVRLYQNRDGGRFAQLPQYQDKNGKWNNLVQFNNAMFDCPELTRCIEQAYENEKKKQHQAQIKKNR